MTNNSNIIDFEIHNFGKTIWSKLSVIYDYDGNIICMHVVDCLFIIYLNTLLNFPNYLKSFQCINTPYFVQLSSNC